MPKLGDRADRIACGEKGLRKLWLREQTKPIGLAGRMVCGAHPTRVVQDCAKQSQTWEAGGAGGGAACTCVKKQSQWAGQRVEWRAGQGAAA
jgi:hypothetical protein